MVLNLIGGKQMLFVLTGAPFINSITTSLAFCAPVTSLPYPTILPHNIYLIVILINERQQLWDERSDIARRIFYLNIDEALMGNAELVKSGKSYLQGTCSEGLVLEFTIANLLSLSLERQHDQLCEQNHRCGGEYSWFHSQNSFLIKSGLHI